MQDTLFARAGRVLYGEGFIPSLAAALQVNERTVQRWVAGSAWPPRGVWLELAAQLRRREQECAALAGEVEAVIVRKFSE